MDSVIERRARLVLAGMVAALLTGCGRAAVSTTPPNSDDSALLADGADISTEETTVRAAPEDRVDGDPDSRADERPDGGGDATEGQYRLEDDPDITIYADSAGVSEASAVSAISMQTDVNVNDLLAPVRAEDGFSEAHFVPGKAELVVTFKGEPSAASMQRLRAAFSRIAEHGTVIFRTDGALTAIEAREQYRDPLTGEQIEAESFCDGECMTATVDQSITGG